MTKREFALVLCGLAAVYLPLSLLPAPDLHIFLFPWLRHIQQFGPIGAFAHPFSNYSPPYLYLLAAVSTFDLPDIATIKLISAVGFGWLAFCVALLARTLGRDPLPAALLTLALPTAIMNSVALGQCDTFWVGFCVLAVSAALQEKPYSMALFAGCAFAFKAQSAFLAPLCIAYLIQRRAWPAILIPPIIYLLAIAPAALAGWPIADLLTVYVKQAGTTTYIGDAPNVWALFRNYDLIPIGYSLAATAAIALACVRKIDPLRLALLCAFVLPFLLPKMTERSFFLADVLSLVIAYASRERRDVVVAALIQTGSALAIAGYLVGLPEMKVVGLAAMSGAAIVGLLSGRNVRQAQLRTC